MRLLTLGSRTTFLSHFGVTSLIPLALLVCTPSRGLAQSATYYISPTGNDLDPGTSSQPWGTFEHAVGPKGVLLPGDTLVLKNGTYDKESLHVRISGMPGKPITIRAEKDGEAIIDGGFAFRPGYIGYMPNNGPGGPIIEHVDIEGIRFQRSLGTVLTVVYSQNINIRRVSAYQAKPATNEMAFNIQFSDNVLLEDVAGASGRTIFNIYETNNATVRRCWGRYTSFKRGTTPGVVVHLYGADNTLVENCVGLKDPSFDDQTTGLDIFSNTYNMNANNNAIYGNVMYGFRGVGRGYFLDINPNSQKTNEVLHNVFHNNVGIDSGEGFRHKTDHDLTIDRMTLLGSSLGHYHFDGSSYGGAVALAVKLRNSNFVAGPVTFAYSNGGTVTRDDQYNNFFQNADGYQGTNSFQIDPDYCVQRFSKGAYLIQPNSLRGQGENGADIGAEILYRYQDKVLTNVPLWPLPMEDRIRKESTELFGECFSATYETIDDPTYGRCKGGLWSTLDGAYDNPAQCAGNSSDGGADGGMDAGGLLSDGAIADSTGASPDGDSTSDGGINDAPGLSDGGINDAPGLSDGGINKAPRLSGSCSIRGSGHTRLLGLGFEALILVGLLWRWRWRRKG